MSKNHPSIQKIGKYSILLAQSNPSLSLSVFLTPSHLTLPRNYKFCSIALEHLLDFVLRRVRFVGILRWC